MIKEESHLNGLLKRKPSIKNEIEGVGLLGNSKAPNPLHILHVILYLSFFLVNTSTRAQWPRNKKWRHKKQIIFFGFSSMW